MDKEIDPYPKFNEEHKAWFMAILQGMVKLPSEVNFCRVRGGNDLEIGIIVARSDEYLFTPEVCKALKVLLAATTGVFSPVVYLDGKPHAEAQESIDAARSGM